MVELKLLKMPLLLMVEPENRNCKLHINIHFLKEREKVRVSHTAKIFNIPESLIATLLVAILFL